MINELPDEDILEFLLTSEFDNNYKNEELKFLLYKFRHFYRILHGKHTTIKGDKDFEISQLNDVIRSLKSDIEKLLIKNADLQNTIDLSKKGRRLTWRERWNGNINQF